MISYLQENYNEIVESIETFENVIITIKESVKVFKNMLPLITDNKSNGLKGECDSCRRLNEFESN